MSRIISMVSDYIHLNPVRAGMVDRANGGCGRYPWSSRRYLPALRVASMVGPGPIV